MPKACFRVPSWQAPKHMIKPQLCLALAVMGTNSTDRADLWVWLSSPNGAPHINSFTFTVHKVHGKMP